MRTSNPEAQRILSLEYAATDQHKRKVVSAVQRIQTALQDSRMPYVAYTSGKDSTVVLALVEQLTGGVAAAWSDDELEYPETVEIMERLNGDIAFTVTGGVSRHAGWFDPWEDAPYWRDPLPGTVWINGDQDDWMGEQGFDLTFTGLRAEESRKRRDWLIYADATWGAAYPVRGGTGRRCTPIWDWTAADVWAYIYGHNLPVNPVYTRLSEIGVLPHRQRVGPLPLARRADLVAGWPDLLERLESRYGKRWA